MNILLVNPEYPDTFWSFKHAIRFASRKAAQPPLGLLTVAALLPQEWSTKLVDLSLGPIVPGDLRWADYVFLGGMSVQAESARKVIALCKRAGATVVAGGPMFTARHKEFGGVDHFVLNEAEITLPRFLDDLMRGRPQPLYTTDEWADMTASPMPRWDLVDRQKYISMNIQYSRGCPFDCEFCDITVLYGRVPRTKSGTRVIAEMDGLYRSGWRGHVFFVDDNFIGNRILLKKDVLPRIIRWMEDHSYPFTLGTEATLNLADDPELLDLMARSGFDEVFVGIENPNEESLEECRKIPNRNRDLIASVKILQKAGLQVQGGFIVGFDHDPPTIFDTLIRFIKESGIVVAMVGLLNAPLNTRLYHRLDREGRILSVYSGDNTDFSMNFIPKMNQQALLAGYRKILSTIYSPREYYARVTDFLRFHHPHRLHKKPLRPVDLYMLLKSMFVFGFFGKERLYYWKLFFWSIFCRPRHFAMAITFAVYGFHFRRVFEEYASHVPLTGSGGRAV